MDGKIVGFHLEWKLRPTSEGWIGVSSPLGMVVDGNSFDSFASNTEKLVDFLVETFDAKFSEEEFRDYLEAHNVEYFEDLPDEPVTTEPQRELRMSGAYSRVR